MLPKQTPNTDADNESPDWFYRWFCAGLVVVGVVLILQIILFLTEAVKTVHREQLIQGTRSFVGLLLLAVVAVTIMTLAIRGFVAFFGTTLSGAFRRIRLRSARRRAEKAIDRKQELIEERIRLGARLRATFLFERECYRLANAQARQEFRDALQNSVTRSCEIAFKQITQVIDQYENVCQEIGESALDDTQKTELLDKLTRQLSVAATEQKTRSAERLMDEQIWTLRMETAQCLSRRSPESAVQYLQNVESSTVPGPGRRRAQALLRRLKRESKTQRAT